MIYTIFKIMKLRALPAIFTLAKLKYDFVRSLAKFTQLLHF